MRKKVSSLELLIRMNLISDTANKIVSDSDPLSRILQPFLLYQLFISSGENQSSSGNLTVATQAARLECVIVL